jgi:hypothetical protein
MMKMKKLYISVIASIIVILLAHFIWWFYNVNRGLEDGKFSGELPMFFTDSYLNNNGFKWDYHPEIRYKDSVYVNLAINNKSFSDTVNFAVRSHITFFFYRFDFIVNSPQDAKILLILESPPDTTIISNYVDAWEIKEELFRNHDDRFVIVRHQEENGAHYEFIEKDWHKRCCLSYSHFLVETFQF